MRQKVFTKEEILKCFEYETDPFGDWSDLVLRADLLNAGGALHPLVLALHIEQPSMYRDMFMVFEGEIVRDGGCTLKVDHTHAQAVELQDIDNVQWVFNNGRPCLNRIASFDDSGPKRWEQFVGRGYILSLWTVGCKHADWIKSRSIFLNLTQDVMRVVTVSDQGIIVSWPVPREFF